MPIDIRPLDLDDRAELERWERTRMTAFGHAVDLVRLDSFLALMEPGRLLAAYDGDLLVGTAAALRFALTVPGDPCREVATAGVKAITTLPTHRRRGVMNSLMRHQLDELAAGDEPLAVLWATEGGIYRRFGYGVSTGSLRWAVDGRGAPFHAGVPVAGRARLLDTTDTAKTIAAIRPVYERARARRPGVIDRNDLWWQRRANVPAGAAAFYVVIDGSDGIDAYARYSIDASWTSRGPSNAVHVEEAVAVTPAAEAALWRYLLDLDLATSITAWGRPTDESLPHLLADGRAIERTLSEGLWLRLLDLPAALAARAYRTDASIVLEVRDEWLPANAGTWRLECGPDGGRCTRAEASPDLLLDTADLAAAYLGGASFAELVGAGRIHEETPGAAAHADLAFGWSPAPWAMTWF